MSRKSRREGKPGFFDSPAFRDFVGWHILGGYVRLAMKTTIGVDFYPPDYNERVRAQYPVLIAMWHANITATAYPVPDHHLAVGLSSPHPDGRMGAAAIRSAGGRVIFGAGRTERQPDGTRAIAGSREILRALSEGTSVLVTADIPPIPGRKVSRGLIRLARIAGRPIVPVGIASTRRTILHKLWDQMQVNHPFSRYAVVGGDFLTVDDSVTDDEAMAVLKVRLDEAYARALELTARP